MNVNLQYATEVVKHLSPSERLQLLATLANSLRRDLDVSEFGEMFWQTADPLVLAESQGFHRPTEIQPLSGSGEDISDEELDEFIATVRSWRNEDLRRFR